MTPNKNVHDKDMQILSNANALMQVFQEPDHVKFFDIVVDRNPSYSPHNDYILSDFLQLSIL